MPRASPETIANCACVRPLASLSRHLQSDRRGVSRSDDGDRRTAENLQIAFHRDQRRPGLDRRQRRGIVGFAARYEARSGSGGDVQFAFGIAGAADAEFATAFLPDQLRQGVERRSRPAMAVQKALERAGPHAFRSGQTQPVEPLPVTQRPAGWRQCPCPAEQIAHDADRPIRLSVPASNRAMLDACRQQSMAEQARNNAASAVCPETRNRIGRVALATRAESDE